MHDAAVAGSLEVMGAATLSGKLRALQGVELGDGGRLLFSVLGESVSCLSDLAFSAGCGIRISGVTVLKGSGANDVRLEMHSKKRNARTLYLKQRLPSTNPRLPNSFIFNLSLCSVVIAGQEDFLFRSADGHIHL